MIVKHQQATAMITPTVSAGQASSRPSSAKSDSSKSPATSSDEGDSEYISYSDGSSEGTVLSSLVGNANIVIKVNKHSPKWKRQVVDIYQAMKPQGKYPQQATDTEVNSCLVYTEKVRL